jgi:two-component system, OmpR family, phosphate regulon response regulator PhoB
MSGRPTVVLVEDERPVAAMYMIGLEVRGFRVLLFNSGTALLGQLAELTPDVIVLDWMLPGIDGAHVFATLRRDTRTRDIPILILSALSNPNVERDSALKAGASAWLEKAHTPPKVLAQKIQELLARSGAKP